MTIPREPQFRQVSPTSPGAQTAMRRYVVELKGRLPHGFTVEEALAAAVDAYAPPRGTYLLCGSAADPVAGGALTYLDAHRAEVKRMWVAPESRGRGLAASLLGALEEAAVVAGRDTMVLDTNSALDPAVRLYERHGYRRTERYNDNLDADVWFTKALTRAVDADPSRP